MYNRYALRISSKVNRHFAAYSRVLIANCLLITIETTHTKFNSYELKKVLQKIFCFGIRN
jgi:hypothetical protein